MTHKRGVSTSHALRYNRRIFRPLRGPWSHPVRDPHSPQSPSLTGALALARRLAQRREVVELQGTVLHRSTARTLSVTLLAAAVLSLLGPVLPPLGAALLLLMLPALLTDQDGGAGWTRKVLVLKDIGHNILLWRNTRLPTPADPAAFQQHPPSPPAEPISTAPQLLVCAPLDDADIHHTRSHAALYLLGEVSVALAAVSLLVPALRSAGAPRGAAALLLLLSGAAALLHRLRPAPEPPSPAVSAAEALAAALQKAPPEALEVSLAFLGGLYAHGDGIEVLLKTYAPVLPPEHARVLILLPGEGPLAAQPKAGLFGRLQADPLLVAAAEGQEDPGRSAPAARALRIGWRAATLRGDLSDTERLMALIHRLDHAAASDQW